MVGNNISHLKLNIISKVEFERLLNTNRPELLRMFAQSKSELIKMSDMVLETITHAEKQIKHNEHINEWTSIREIWNVIGFIVLSSLDLKTYMELMMIAHENIQKIAITRMVYTQLYEIAKNIDELTNIRFTNEMEKVNANKYIDELYQKRNLLSELNKKYKKELYAIRINIGAHREKDYKIFHQYLCSIDYTASIQLVLKYNEVFDELGETIQKIMIQSIEFLKEIYQKREEI